MIAQTATAITPTPPGRIGAAITPEEALRYLEALGAWRDQRRAELDRLDEAALAATNGESATGRTGASGTTGTTGLTGDVLLSMALWKAVADRHDLLVATWDSGRVGQSERERLATLIWGRLDATLDPRLAQRPDVPSSSGALAVSLPEAMRLSDALASSLRARLSLDPADADVTNRLRQLRAQLERVRDLTAALPHGATSPEATAGPPGAAEAGATSEPRGTTGPVVPADPNVPAAPDVTATPQDTREAFSRKLKKLDHRLGDIVDKAKRGADVGGLVGPLEADAARTERDLIVGSATRAEAALDLTRADELRAELAARGAAIRDLANRCVATVNPAPRLAVPDVAALGPVPQKPAEVAAYLTRLATVSRALNLAHAAYARALDERAELRGQLEAYAIKASRVGTGSLTGTGAGTRTRTGTDSGRATGARDGGADDDLGELFRRAQEVLGAEPTDMTRARALVAAHQAYLAALSTPTGKTGGST